MRRWAIRLSSCMVIALFCTFSYRIQTADNRSGPSSIDQTKVTVETIAFLESQLVTSDNAYESSMDELSARLTWVQEGKVLTPEARRRTIIRANNPNPDYVGVWPKRVDVGTTKRHMSIWIIEHDNKNIQDAHALETK